MATATRLLALAGNPVAHSLSPTMQNAAIAALGIDARYVAARTTERAFPGMVRDMIKDGGALNVTIPFKPLAARLLHVPSELVRRTGACNTIWGEGGRIHGDNTDVPGVRAAARELLKGRAAPRALLLGTGGSSHAAAVALADEWPGCEVLVVSRDKDRAREFTAWARAAGVAAMSGTAADTEGALVINATPLGLAADDPLPMPETNLEGALGVLDLIYARGGTALVRAARAQGIASADGRGVLVEQGVVAFQRFFGVEPPVQVMRKAVEDALRP